MQAQMFGGPADGQDFQIPHAVAPNGGRVEYYSDEGEKGIYLLDTSVPTKDGDVQMFIWQGYCGDDND